ncbi:MAG: hypothetical protein KGI23_02040 [Patescibacteria group bacterium]|nr:hypothetical protein [Patescibacteria group bacterium]
MLPFLFTFAQGVPTSIQGIDLKLSTDNPTPGQNLTITAESYIADLNSSNITWTLNGNTYQKGIGVTSIQVIAPDLGKKLAVAVSAATPDGKTLSTNITVTTGSIDFIIESDGYTPPFFQGKIPLVYQNTYKVIAIPHIANSSGVEYDPKTLVYQWTKDTKVVQSASGYGKQVFIWTDEVVPRPRMINLKVTTRDGTASAEKTVILQAGSPFIQFYNNDPLYGPLYNKAIGNSVGLGSSGELSVLAVPYGFNGLAGNTNDLSFSWMVNSLSQAALSASQSIVLRAPAGQSGSSNIQLRVENSKDILQSASNGFSAVFSDNGSQTATSTTFNNYNGI